jgi:hypothetical protein
MLPRIAGDCRRPDDVPMRLPRDSGPPPRDADNVLYDRGCDLVEAAAAIRGAAASPQAVRAVPAVLGCIESALGELLWAAALLEATTIQMPGDQEIPGRDGERRERMHTGFANLQRTLSDAAHASGAARALAARVLVATDATPPS